MNTIEIYCIQCKANTYTLNLKQHYVGKLSNIPMVKGECTDCSQMKAKRGYIDRTYEANKIHETYSNPKKGFSSYVDISQKANQNVEFTKEELYKNETFSKHKPIRLNFERLRVIVHYPDQQWQADLVDMRHIASKNKNYNYLLTVIDCFSKFAWAVPMKTKNAKNTVEAFKNIIDKADRVPEKLQTDKGKEFYNADFQDYCYAKEISHFSTENYDIKACIVERFNRTLKGKMYKYFTDKNTTVWVDVIDDLVENYNNSVHRSIKMTPIEASKIENTTKVFKNLFPQDLKIERADPVFTVGNLVRVVNKKKIFEKGYTPNWSEQVYRITKVYHTVPYTYKVNEFKKLFYKEELNLVSE